MIKPFVATCGILKTKLAMGAETAATRPGAITTRKNIGKPREAYCIYHCVTAAFKRRGFLTVQYSTVQYVHFRESTHQFTLFGNP